MDESLLKVPISCLLMNSKKERLSFLEWCNFIFFSYVICKFVPFLLDTLFLKTLAPLAKSKYGRYKVTMLS